MGRGRFYGSFSGIEGFVTLHNRAIRWEHMLTEKARTKFEILIFWEKHSLDATMDAFSVSRRTLFLWKKQLRTGHGKCTALNERSRTPKNKRIRAWPLELLEEIKRIRMQHPNLGKAKLQKLLIPFCRRNAIPIPSVSTVGRITADKYDSLIEECKAQEAALLEELQGHSDADQAFLISCSYILELAKRAS